MLAEASCESKQNAGKDFEKYVRSSANHVRDEIYEACAELSGHGFSYHECQIALSVVSRLFGCSWTIPPENRGHTEFSEEEEAEEIVQFDNNTLPTRKAMRKMLERMDVHSLKLSADKIADTKESDSVVTHATDSTTRKKVGCFAPQGVHIDRDTYILH